MEIREILMLIGFVIVFSIGVIRIVNNIRNGRKWYEGFPTGE